MENGVLRSPDLHDGLLTAVVLVGETTLELHCQTVDRTLYVLRLRDLVRLRVDNFLEGNIIFEIRTFPSNECPTEIIDRLYPPSPMGVRGTEQPEARRAVAEGWTYVCLESSYGCELVALAKKQLEINKSA